MSFSARLKEERKRLGLNQTEMASACGVVKKSQVVYESGKSASPTAEYLMASVSLGVDVQYLLTGVRSDVALTPEECLLLRYYQEASPEIRKAAMAVLLSGAPQTQGVMINGNVSGGSVVAHTINHPPKE